MKESVVRFSYELRRAENGALIAEGETTHIVTNAEMKITEIPDKYMKVFREAVGKAGSSGKLQSRNRMPI